MLTYNSEVEHAKQNHNPIRFAKLCENCANRPRNRAHYSTLKQEHVFISDTSIPLMSAHILSSLHCPLCEDGVPYSIGSNPMDYEDDNTYPA